MTWRKMPIPEIPRSAAQDPRSSKNRTPACLCSQSLAGLLPVLPRGLLDVLPDGFTTEVCPAAEAWWRQAAQALRQGRLLTIDYGLTSEEFYTPERARGTLRAYWNHRASAEVLSPMGECDLTASVNFTILQNGGEAMGLTTDLLLSQERFLGRIAQCVWPTVERKGSWSADNGRQLQTLIHPEHLGRAFQVLVQSRA